MKVVFEHPPEENGGRKYWRSLDEYSQTDEFRQWLEREFPAGASEFWGDGVSRRSFLRLMGASMALAGLGMAGCRRPEAYLVPFTRTPEWMIPGRYLLFATAMPRRTGAVPLMATSFEGRPTLLNGHPEHPFSRGKSDAWTQAAVLDLYQPDRAHRFLHEGKQVTVTQFEEMLGEVRAAALADQGKGLAIVMDEPHSPTRDRLVHELQQAFPEARFAVHEPLATPDFEAACDAYLGRGVRPRWAIEQADLIFSLGDDFLGHEQGNLEAIREFARRRHVTRKTDPDPNRLYVIENRFTNTGAMADHRLRVPASRLANFFAALLDQLRDQGLAHERLSAARALLPAPEEGEFDPEWVREAAADILAHRGRALILAGRHQPVQVQLAALALNDLLGSFSKTITLHQTQCYQSPTYCSLQEVADALRAGTVKDLVILGANPVYDAPVDLDWAEAQARAQRVVAVADLVHETGAKAHWFAPMTHFLEQWGDGVAPDGTLLCIQPLILPLYDAWSEIDVLSVLLGQPKPQGPAAVRQTFEALVQPKVQGFELEQAWYRFRHDGFQKGSMWSPVTPESLPRSCNLETLASAPRPSKESLEVVFVSDASVDDGRKADNGWLQEMPDPITKLTWENAVLVSPRTAAELGLRSGPESGIYHGDVVRLQVAGRELEAPVLIAPGHADYSLTLALGYGRTHCGKTGRGQGFNAYRVRPGQAEFVSAVTQTKTDRRHDFAVTQEHHSMEGRELVREAPLEFFREHEDFAQFLGVDSHVPKDANGKIPSFYPHPPLSDPMQWGMVIDLNQCIGCAACVIACQAENNIPIVGKQQVAFGREMHWIRIDRYFASKDDATLPEDADILMQPVTCMHCENAPCEVVCPVNATVHSADGLNVMAYNRCIGTRYCANNCPYKVRRFNYFDFNKRQLDQLYFGPLGREQTSRTLRMQKNPNVTVRMRGVIEKCTFCVQRIQNARIDHKVAHAGTADIVVEPDSFQTACQQACPAEAITFGDIKRDGQDGRPESKVHRLKQQPTDYSILAYLGIKPRVSYLARIRNPNPRMPGADQIGKSLLKKKAAYLERKKAKKAHAAAGHDGGKD